jgi:hypothetical protein
MFAFVIALLWSLFTGQGHVVTYDNPGQRGVIVQIDATHCVGYEFAGDAGPGAFGNTLGLTGGECS